MEISVDVAGLGQLKKTIDSVKYDVAKKGGRFALRKAAQVIRDQVRSNARQLNDPATGRSIAENVAERWNGRYNKITGDLAFRIGILGGAKTAKKGEKVDYSAGGPTPHWRLLEFGTERMAAHPFFMPGVAQSAQAAVDTFTVQYSKALERAIAKAHKGG